MRFTQTEGKYARIYGTNGTNTKLEDMFRKASWVAWKIKWKTKITEQNFRYIL